MLHQIERCSAPCVGLISEAQYQADVHAAILFLQGKVNEVQSELQRQMEEASQQLAFERAAELRDKLQRLRYLQAQHFVESDKTRDADVIAIVEEGGITAVNLVMIRGGRHVGDRTLFPSQANERTREEIATAFLEQHYFQKLVPPTIVLDVAVSPELAKVLSEQAGYKVTLFTRAIGEKRQWLTMAARNAKLAIGQKAAERATQEMRLNALREALGMPEVSRIECFDISHTMGEAAVASCVVFDRGTMQHGEYRRFNIKPEVGGDDYGSLKEALTRRAKRIAGSELPKPDLWVIDGGKGQLHVAEKVLEELPITTHLISLGKGPERIVGDEDIWISGKDEPLRLPPDNVGFQLLQQIRDESHRFAIQGHRARRAKARVTSSLEEIDGIGDKRRRELLNHFGGLKGVRAAGIDELAKVPGISRALAVRIFEALH
jgi:excinuclease ABC subunit C